MTKKKGGEKVSYLFSIDTNIDTKFEEELNKGIISEAEELKEEFNKNKFLLSDTATVKKEEKKWEITDEKKFIIKKEEGKLNIYKVSFEEVSFIGMITMGTIIGIFIGMIIGIGLLVGEYCCNFNLAVLVLLSIVAIILILISLLCESLDCWKACKGCKNQIFLVILTIFVIIIGVVIGTYLYYPSYSATFKAFILSWILIGTFILSLICMDYMTCKAYKSNESNRKRKELIETLKGNEKLCQLLLLEPVGVLDKHEIRRSLTISITITYFVLLALSIFGIGELTPKSDMIDLFTKAFLVMIAFYFGSRAIEEGIKLYETMKILK